MRLRIATANRASIVLMAVLLASCYNTSPGLQVLPLGSPGAESAAHRRRRQRRRHRTVRVCGKSWFRQRLRFRDCGRRRVDVGCGLAV